MHHWHYLFAWPKTINYPTTSKMQIMIILFFQSTDCNFQYTCFQIPYQTADLIQIKHTEVSPLHQHDLYVDLVYGKWPGKKSVIIVTTSWPRSTSSKTLCATWWWLHIVLLCVDNDRVITFIQSKKLIMHTSRSKIKGVNLFLNSYTDIILTRENTMLPEAFI